MANWVAICAWTAWTNLASSCLSAAKVLLHQAGFGHLLAVELDRRARDAADKWRAGMGRAGRWSRATSTRWTSPGSAGEMDVVAGGVPCQPWSLGGVRKGYDDRRDLRPELFRCVRETRPQAIVTENVKGLLRPSFRVRYEYILRELAADGSR